MNYLNEADWKKVLDANPKAKSTGISEKLRAAKAAEDAFAKTLDVPGSKAWVVRLQELKKLCGEVKAKHPGAVATFLAGTIAEVDKRLKDQEKWVANKIEKATKLKSEVAANLTDCTHEIERHLEEMRQFMIAGVDHNQVAPRQLQSEFQKATQRQIAMLPQLFKSGDQLEVSVNRLFANASLLAPKDPALNWNHIEFVMRVKKFTEAFKDNVHHGGLVARMHTDLANYYESNVKKYFESVKKHLG